MPQISWPVHPSILSPRLLGGLRRRFVPFKPVGDAMHMNVYADAHVSVRDQANDNF